jgi:hypothetical protein
MGHSRVLDSALDLALTAAAFLAMPSVDIKASVILMRKLGVAVASLKAAISDSEECMSADVLAAVSLLSSYEVGIRSHCPWSSRLMEIVYQINACSSVDKPSQRTIPPA